MRDNKNMKKERIKIGRNKLVLRKKYRYGDK
jgi:hypothetical protein